MTVISDPETARDALQAILNKYFGHLKPEKDYRPITREEIALTAVCCVRQTSPSADFPGSECRFLHRAVYVGRNPEPLVRPFDQHDFR